MDKISVIVPVYNVENYLEMCVDSILNQTYKGLEVILIDDGSTDLSGSICDDFAKKDSRVIVLHQSNGGVSVSRNKGIESATGKYIMFCDSDDVVEQHWCEYMYKAVCNNFGSLIVSDWEQFGNETFLNYRYCDTEMNIQKTNYYSLFCKVLTGSVCNKIFRTDIIMNNYVRFPIGIPIAEDVLFVHEYMKYCGGGCLYLANTLYYYRDNSRSAMHKYHKNLLRYHLLAFYVRLPYIEEKYITEYCNGWLSVFIPELQNIFDKRNVGMTWIEKMCYNHKMLNTEEFRTCLKYVDKSKETPFVLYLLKRRLYWIYWCLVKMIECKNRYFKIDIINKD